LSEAIARKVGAGSDEQGASMTRARRSLVAGNWKMNGLLASAQELAQIAAGAMRLQEKADLMV
jgi:hypothetical protein